MPVPQYTVPLASNPSRIDQWREQMLDSYQWIGRHRPELETYLSPPYGVNLMLLDDATGAARVVDRAINQSRSPGEEA